MIDDRKYLKNGYVLSAPKCRISSTSVPPKSCFIDTNRISYIDHSLGDFSRVSREIKERREKRQKRDS